VLLALLLLLFMMLLLAAAVAGALLLTLQRPCLAYRTAAMGQIFFHNLDIEYQTGE
jgi:hypothetical protein